MMNALHGSIWRGGCLTRNPSLNPNNTHFNMFMFSLYFHRYLAVAATPRDLDGGGGCSDGMGEGDEEGESKGGAAGGALLSVPLGEVGGERVGPKWTDMAALEELCLALVLALVDAARTLSSEDAVVRAMDKLFDVRVKLHQRGGGGCEDRGGGGSEEGEGEGEGGGGGGCGGGYIHTYILKPKGSNALHCENPISVFVWG